MKDWIAAFRLRTLPLAFSCILMGSGLAIYLGFFQKTIFFLTLVTTLFLQILSNLANDYGDTQNGADNAERIGPQRAVQSKKISLTAMRKAIIVFVLLSLSSGIPLVLLSGGTFNPLWVLSFLFLGGFSIWAAIKYTSGSNPYGYRGYGDFFVFLFFGLIGVVGAFLMQAQMVVMWFLEEVLLLAISVGLLSAAVLNLNNMRDIKSDKSANKNTVALKLGFNGAKLYHTGIICLAIVCFNLTIYRLDFSIYEIALCNIPSLLLLIHLFKVLKVTQEKDFDPELKKVALSTFLQALIFIITTSL